MRFGTRAQFFVPLLAVLAVMVLVIGVTAWKTIQRERALLNARLNAIGDTIEHAHFPLTDAVLIQMKGLTGAEFCVVQPHRPTVTTMTIHPTKSLIERILSLRTGNGLDHPMDVNGMEYFVRIHHRPAALRQYDGTLLILYPVSRWKETVSEAIRPVLTIGIAGLVIAAALTLLLGNRFVNRIRDLESQTRRIAAGDFQSMRLPHRNDELRDLAASVNHMAEQLQSLQGSLREAECWRVLGQMAGGLAHQLRNGVAGVKLALQLQERESSTPLDEPFRVAQRQLSLIELQLQRFLELGRQPHEPTIAIDLADVAHDAIVLIQPRCQHFGIPLQVDIADDLPDVIAERGQVLQLLVNLLDNAVEAAGPGGQVELSIVNQVRRIELIVSDSGSGPPPAIADQLFDPFVTGKPNGVGLGLAVVLRVVEGLHGTVSWDRVNDRTRFCVTIPTSIEATPRSISARERSFI